MQTKTPKQITLRCHSCKELVGVEIPPTTKHAKIPDLLSMTLCPKCEKLVFKKY